MRNESRGQCAGEHGDENFLGLFPDGLRDADIPSRLFVAETLATYIRSILRKLNVRS